MITAVLSVERRRWFFRRRRFVVQIPERWEELPPRRRRKWWAWSVSLQRPAALQRMLESIGPKVMLRALPPDQLAPLHQAIKWAAAEPQCATVPLHEVRHGGASLLMPRPNGENMTCFEFAISDHLYEQYLLKQDDKDLHTLTYCLFRERDSDSAAADARSDDRLPLRSEREAARRIERLGPPSLEMQVQALLYFGGLKNYIRATYGSWIFEEPDDDEDDTKEKPESQEPNFGWWGIFQSVAEGGAFGDLERVYQTGLHDVCVYLVRKRVEANRVQQFTPSIPKHDDL